jgi:ribosomal protein S24E
MEMKIIEQKENPLFKRNEVLLEVVSNVSPKNSEILKAIAEKLSVPEENVKVRGIYGNFGTHVFSVYANVYKSSADKESTEVKTKKERDAEKKSFEEKMKLAAEEKKKSTETKSEENEEKAK